MKSPDEQIGSTILAHRTKLLLTQEELAEKSGIAQSTISQLENGKLRVVSRETLEQLSRILGFRIPAEQHKEEITGKETTEETCEELVACCPNPDCPEGISMIGEGYLFTRPKFFLIPPGETLFCSACGTALITKCQTSSCEALLDKGSSHCGSCGDPYAKYDLPFNGPDVVRFLKSKDEQRRKYGAAPPIKRLSKNIQAKNTSSRNKEREAK